MSYCQVIFEKNNNHVNGLITGLEETIQFNPLNILFELRFTQAELDYENFICDGFDYEYEFGFGIPIEIKNEERDLYAKLIMTIRTLLLESHDSRKRILLDKIEHLRYYFNIGFKFSAFSKIPNPMKNVKGSSIFPELSDTEYADSIIFSSNGPDDILLPFSYNHYSLESATNYDLSKCKEYFYACSSITEVIFAILHFLALNKCKIAKCKHCQRYYATPTYKIEYCTRNSIHPTYEHLHCEQAVRNIMQQFGRTHHQIYKNLYQLYLNEPDKLDEFQKTYNELIENVKKYPTLQNIDDGFSILDKRKWYTKDKQRIRGKKNNFPHNKRR